MATCCCNISSPSTKCICGTWTIPEDPDEGQCFPYREKRTCEVTPIPVIQCDDDEYITIFDPEDEENPFKVSSRLFDENCEVITDQLGDPILTLKA
jgi:hypothetical protein